MKLFSPFALPFVAGCIWASCVTASGAGAIPAGSYLIKVSDGSRSILVYTYKPKSGTDGPLLLVFACGSVAAVPIAAVLIVTL